MLGTYFPDVTKLTIAQVTQLKYSISPIMRSMWGISPHTWYLARVKTLARHYFQCLFYVCCKTGDHFLTEHLVDFKTYTSLQGNVLKSLFHTGFKIRQRSSEIIWLGHLIRHSVIM